MDVIYPYKRQGDEFELRYSLRSLVHVPHDRVIVGGDKPRFATSCLLWAGAVPRADRFKSSTENFVAAIEQYDVTGDFLAMNDDFFILRPWSYRCGHRGTITEYLATDLPSGGYRCMVERTRDILQAFGITRPLFFGLHKPIVFDSARLLSIAREFRGESYSLRTLYGNLFPQPSELCDDVKVRQWAGAPDCDVISTSDECGRDEGFRSWIAAKFSAPSIYENDAAHVKEAA